jgi:hypothetical protein
MFAQRLHCKRCRWSKSTKLILRGRITNKLVSDKQVSVAPSGVAGEDLTSSTVARSFCALWRSTWLRRRQCARHRRLEVPVGLIATWARRGEFSFDLGPHELHCAAAGGTDRGHPAPLYLFHNKRLCARITETDTWLEVVLFHLGLAPMKLGLNPAVSDFKLSQPHRNNQVPTKCR